MSAIDSVTALGRLLRDGALRDAYAAQPAQTIQDMDVLEADRATLLNLNTEDLEAQASVLLRKRFESISRLLPQTCARLRDEAWPSFAEYSRRWWPPREPAGVIDANQFFRHLEAKGKSVTPKSERNRIHFGLSHRRFAIYLTPDLFIRNRVRMGVQIFLRRSPAMWREYVIYCA